MRARAPRPARSSISASRRRRGATRIAFALQPRIRISEAPSASPISRARSISSCACGIRPTNRSALPRRTVSSATSASGSSSPITASASLHARDRDLVAGRRARPRTPAGWRPGQRHACPPLLVERDRLARSAPGPPRRRPARDAISPGAVEQLGPARLVVRELRRLLEVALGLGRPPRATRRARRRARAASLARALQLAGVVGVGHRLVGLQLVRRRPPRRSPPRRARP